MPLSFLIVPYFIVLIFFVVLTGAAVYHIVRYDFINTMTISAMTLFFVSTFIVLSVTYASLQDIHWNETILFSNNISSPVIDDIDSIF